MNPKDNYINDISFQKLMHNENYYRHIFKKTEKIVSTVFYILNNIDINKKSETHISNIASKAHLVHEHAIRTLEVRPSSATEVLEQFAQALIGLDSSIRVAAATGAVPQSVLAVIVGEIDVALRGLSAYLSSDSSLISTSLESTGSRQTRRTPAAPVYGDQTNSSTPAARTAVKQSSPTQDRRERIKTILEAKGEASIKDISDIITDCSEKTLQRELNAMIEENIVKRQGERRWSKYSIF